MQVILTKRVRNLGNIGDLVTIKPGYARNYLLPSEMAIRASKSNLADFEQRRAELEKAEVDSLAAAQARAETFSGVNVTIAAQAADEGKLYGAVNVRDVVVALVEAGHAIEKREVVLTDGPIRVVGEYSVNLLLHPEVEAQVTVIVTEKE